MIKSLFVITLTLYLPASAVITPMMCRFAFSNSKLMWSVDEDITLRFFKKHSIFGNYSKKNSIVLVTIPEVKDESILRAHQLIRAQVYFREVVLESLPHLEKALSDRLPKDLRPYLYFNGVIPNGGSTYNVGWTIGVPVAYYERKTFYPATFNARIMNFVDNLVSEMESKSTFFEGLSRTLIYPNKLVSATIASVTVEPRDDGVEIRPSPGFLLNFKTRSSSPEDERTRMQHFFGLLRARLQNDGYQVEQQTDSSLFTKKRDLRIEAIEFMVEETLYRSGLKNP